MRSASSPSSRRRHSRDVVHGDGVHAAECDVKRAVSGERARAVGASPIFRSRNGVIAMLPDDACRCACRCTAIESELPSATYSLAFASSHASAVGCRPTGMSLTGRSRDRRAPRSRLGDAARVDAHRLRPRVAALLRGALRRRRLGSAEYGDVCDARVGGDHGGDRFDAERDLANERPGIGVDDRERIVCRQGQHREPLAVRAGAQRDRGSARHVVAERTGLGRGGDRVARCVAVEELELRDAGFRRALASVVTSRPTEDAEYAMRDRIDREREDAGASVDARAGDDSIVAPRDAIDVAWHGDHAVFDELPNRTPPTLPVNTVCTPAGLTR